MNKKIKLINSVHKETTFGIGEGILTELSKNEGKNPPSKIIVLERHSVIEKESMHHDSYNILLVKILDNNYEISYMYLSSTALVVYLQI